MFNCCHINIEENKSSFKNRFIYVCVFSGNIIFFRSKHFINIEKIKNS